MKATSFAAMLLGALVVGAFWISPSISRAGLYDDEAKDVTKGDLNDQDYWWTAFDMTMLDLAIKQHQPEGPIALNLASTSRRLDDLEKKYPKHEGIKAWKAKVDEVNKKIGDADRGGSFKPGCPWNEANFGQAWVNYRWGKMQLDAKDENQAYGLFANVKQNFDILLRPDRMKDYPEDLRKWVEDHKEEVDKLVKELGAKTNH